MALTNKEKHEVLVATSRKLERKGPVTFDKREIIGIAEKIEPEISKCITEIRKSFRGRETAIDNNTVIDFIIATAEQIRKR